MNKITISVNKVVVLREDHGTDIVFLHTDMPSTMPGVSSQKLIIKFEVVKDGAEKYLKDNLGLRVDEFVGSGGFPKGMVEIIGG